VPVAGHVCDVEGLLVILETFPFFFFFLAAGGVRKTPLPFFAPHFFGDRESRTCGHPFPI